MDAGAWLNALGLDQYAQAFAENDIDAEALADLTADDLKERRNRLSWILTPRMSLLWEGTFWTLLPVSSTGLKIRASL